MSQASSAAMIHNRAKPAPQPPIAASGGRRRSLRNLTISTRHPRCYDDLHQTAPEALKSIFITHLFDNQDCARAAPGAYSFEAPEAGFSTRFHHDSFLLIFEAFLHARPSQLRGAWLL
jgi:hypothetical protein